MSGSGTYVTVTEGKVDEMAAGYAGGRNILLEKWDGTGTLVTSLTEDFEGSSEELLALLGTLAVPQSLIDQLGDHVIGDIQGIDFNSITAPTKPTLPGYDSINFPLLGVLKPIPDVDLSYDKPIKPTKVNPVLNYTTTPYNSEMWFTLFTEVKNGIEGTSTGIDPTVEASIFTRGRERQRIPREKALRAATREVTTRGVKFPQLAIRSLEQDAFAQAHQEDTNLNLDIIIKQSDLAQAWKQFIIDRATGLEKILRDFHIAYESLDLEAAKAAAQLLVQVYSENIKAYVAEWQGAIDSIRIQVEKVNAVIASNNLIGDIFEIQAKVAIAETEQISKEREGLVDSYKAETDAYESKVKALTSWYAALSENQRLKLEKDRLEIEKIVQEVRATLDGQISINSLKEKILEGLTNVYAQTLASALNAVNASIGHSTSAGETRSESWRHAEGLSESHSTQHDED